MDRLSNLKHAKGSVKKRKRVGRGQGSGHGGTSTRGENGQLSRSGAKHRLWFEGGQMPLMRRLPKRGFHSPFKVVYQTVNLERLQKLVDDKKIADATVNAAVLYKCGLIRKAAAPYKVLGEGDIKTKLNVEAFAFSESAKQKIEAAGGKIKLIEV
ncbi:MAG: 50S ribosomal protein L15 [Ignavibacteriales bacterium]|nr:MAG: 50S ribosomal protein L15 [Ignavibacteriales bacterium]